MSSSNGLAGGWRFEVIFGRLSFGSVTNVDTAVRVWLPLLVVFFFTARTAWQTPLGITTVSYQRTSAMISVRKIGMFSCPTRDDSYLYHNITSKENCWRITRKTQRSSRCRQQGKHIEEFTKEQIIIHYRNNLLSTTTRYLWT